MLYEVITVFYLELLSHIVNGARALFCHDKYRITILVVLVFGILCMHEVFFSRGVDCVVLVKKHRERRLELCSLLCFVLWLEALACYKTIWLDYSDLPNNK